MLGYPWKGLKVQEKQNNIIQYMKTYDLKCWKDRPTVKNTVVEEDPSSVACIYI